MTQILELLSTYGTPFSLGFIASALIATILVQRFAESWIPFFAALITVAVMSGYVWFTHPFELNTANFMTGGAGLSVGFIAIWLVLSRLKE